MLRILFVLLLIVGICHAADSDAQAYPSKRILLSSPYAAGGGSDTLARLMGQWLTASWGQPIVIENRPGAGGSIGAEVTAKAQADGYTVLVTPSAVLTINPHLYSKLAY